MRTLDKSSKSLNQANPDSNTFTRTPKLRFKGFDDQWESKKLGEIINNKSAKYNSEKDSKSYNCIELEHLSSNTGLLLGYSDSSSSASIKNKFDKGDVLFGKLRPYLRKFLLAPFDGVCSSEIWVLKGQGITNQFLFSLIQTDLFIDLANQSTGSKMPRADWNVVSAGCFYTPSLPEQQKIASFLSAVDEKIQQLTRKKEALERYKKGVMQQLFSGKLRFKIENAAGELVEPPKWEEKRLGEIADIYQPKTISQSELIDIGYDVYGANGIIGKYNKFNHELSQIAVTCRGSTCGVVNYTNPKSWITGNAMVINVDNSEIVNKKFLYYHLFITNLSYLITGSGQPQITGAIKSHPVIIPSIKEQQKIASYLTGIDTKLERVSSQITEAQTFKKGLLQQMFV